MIIDHDINGAPITHDMRPWQRAVLMQASNVGKTTALEWNDDRRFEVLFGDKVDRADPRLPTHLTHFARRLAECISGDITGSQHLRMLKEVARKPVNRLPPLRKPTWLALCVRSAIYEGLK